MEHNAEYVFVIDNGEQLDLTREQAAAAEAAGLIYQPTPDENANYYTTPWDKTLDDVEAFVRAQIDSSEQP